MMPLENLMKQNPVKEPAEPEAESHTGPYEFSREGTGA
jgi:hypothetical protein